MNTKDYDHSIITPIFEIICCLLFILFFIYAGMNFSFMHQFWKIFNSGNTLDSFIYFGSLFFFVVLIVSIIIIAISWIKGADWIEDILPHISISQRRLFLILLTASVCISIIPLFISWSTANPYYSTIGGLLPYSDANGYYNGAEHLLDTGKLDSWSQRRPVNAILFSERLVLTNFDFRAALLLQAIMFGCAAFFAAWAVTRTLGKIAGLMMFAGLFAFAALYIPSTLSEVLGITVGTLGFTLLWLGVTEKKEVLFFSGLIILTLALFIRLGAMLVLPALVLYSGYLFQKEKKYNFKITAIAAISIGFVLFINQSINWLYGDGTGSSFTNLGDSLYGLAVGGKGWNQGNIDYPLNNMTVAQHTNLLLNKSIELILSNPSLFIGTLIKDLINNSIQFIYNIVGSFAFMWVDKGVMNQFLYAPFIDQLPFILPVAIIFLLGIIRFYFYKKNPDMIYFLFITIIAIFLSLPVFYSDTGFRTTAATIPFVAAIISVSIVGLMPKSCLQEKIKKANDSSFHISVFPLVMSIFIVVSALIFPMIGPHLAKTILNPPLEYTEIQPVAENQSVIVTRIDSGMPFIRVVNNDKNTPTFSPNIHSEDFKFFNYSENDSYLKSKIPQNFTLLIAYDIIRHKTIYIQSSDELITQDRHYMKIYAKPFENKSFVYILKNSSIIISPL